jgi:hydroxypyruvate isomerase
MNFSANVSMLFKEVPFVERFERAARAGFSAVEFWWPSGEDLAAVEAAIKDSRLEVVLFNFNAGDMPSGDRGVLSNAARQQEFTDNVPVALELAQRVGCRQLNALVGLALPDHQPDEQLSLAAENVRWAAREAAAIDAKILVEAINTIENGPYLISHTTDAVAFIDRVGEPNVAVQYDVYHMQRMEGNLSATIRRYADYIAHVQVADSPGRNEPGTGEINYPYVFGVLAEVGYSGYVGLEYNPSTTTEQTLGWMPAAAAG